VRRKGGKSHKIGEESEFDALSIVQRLQLGYLCRKITVVLRKYRSQKINKQFPNGEMGSVLDHFFEHPHPPIKNLMFKCVNLIHCLESKNNCIVRKGIVAVHVDI
jgi:hypothetical protein